MTDRITTPNPPGYRSARGTLTGCLAGTNSWPSRPAGITQFAFDSQSAVLPR